MPPASETDQPVEGEECPNRTSEKPNHPKLQSPALNQSANEDTAQPPLSAKSASGDVRSSVTKDLVNETISAVTSRSSESPDAASKEGNGSWKTTLIRFGPLSGIFCMCLAIASIFAALAIVAGSDGQAVSRWSAPPSTYLAIFTAIANLSVRYAAIQGVVIAWWVKAYKGSTLGELHWDWRSGTTVRGALTAGRHFGLLGMACLCSTLVVVDGPLLQRSSTVVTGTVSEDSVTLNVKMVPELPNGFTGAWTTSEQLGFPNYDPAFNRTIPTNNGVGSNEIWPGSLSTWQNDIASQWFNNVPISGAVEGCPEQCRAIIRAPAIVPTVCTSKVIPLVYDDPLNSTLVLSRETAPPLNQDALLVSTNLLVNEKYERLNLITGFGTSTDCKGTLNLTICTLESGIGEYDVLIKSDRIYLDDLQMPNIVSVANNTAVSHTWESKLPGYPSTLSGIADMMAVRWNFLYAAFKEPGSRPTYLGVSSQPTETYVKPGSPHCPSFRDPRDDVLLSMNKLMLYSGVLAAQQDAASLKARLDPGVESNATVKGVLQGNEAVFNTDYWFFLAAALVEVVCIALVMPTYWGWWQIGRSVSFSPLELAKAFESPIFEDCHSNSAGRDLAKARGEVAVQYGMKAVNPPGAKTKVAFGNPASVSQPTKGMQFDV